MNARIGKNFIYNFIAQFSSLIVTLITTPYIARVLHESGNGKYSYSFSIITYFVLFASLGFDFYGQKKIAAFQNDKEKCNEVFWVIFLYKCLFSLISSTVLFCLHALVGFGENYNILILILSVQVVLAPLDIQFFFKGKENFRAIAIRSMMIKIIGMACIFIFVKTEDDLWIYTLCMSLSVVCSNLFMWLSVFKGLGFSRLTSESFRGYFKPSFLIFLPTLAIVIFTVFDKTMIGLLSENPDYNNGCYEQAYRLNSMMVLFLTVISPVFISRNSSEYKREGINAIKKNLYFSANYVWAIGIPMIAGIFILSGNLSFWYLGEGYKEVPLLLIIMSGRFIATGFMELFGNQFFFVIGKEKFFTISAFLAAVINVCMNAFLIPFYGAIGAAIATTVSEFVIAIVLALFVYIQRAISLRRVLCMAWKYIVAGIIMAFPVYFLNSWLEYSIVSFFVCVIVGCLVYGAVLLVLKDRFLLNILSTVFRHVKRIKGGKRL